jgi:cell division protein FtsL
MKLNLTALTLLCVAGVSYGLYQLSYEVQGLEKKLEALDRSISDNNETIRILKAEWAYQNRPDVLQAMATKHLPLLLIAPYQVAGLDEIPQNTAALAETAVPLPRKKPRKSYKSPQSKPLGTVTLATFSKSGGVQ